MKKYLLKIASVILALVVLCFGFTGCVFDKEGSNLPSDKNDNPGNSSNKQEEPAKKLPAPEVVISFDGEAVWGKVEYALYYIYVIDDGEEVITDKCRVQLEENDTITVKAISGSTKYTDSDFSSPATYIKQDVGGEEHTHTDVNSDGLCDKCRERLSVELSFYAINDLHG